MQLLMFPYAVGIAGLVERRRSALRCPVWFLPVPASLSIHQQNCSGEDSWFYRLAWDALLHTLANSSQADARMHFWRL